MTDVVAVHIKTESSDEYLKVYSDVIDSIDLIHRLKDDFSNEFAYISKIIINTDLYYGEIDEYLIYEAIEQDLN